MELLQFICFLVLVVGCLSLCSYYNARIEELENEVKRLHIDKADDKLFKDVLVRMNKDIEMLEDKVIEGKTDVKSILSEHTGRIDYLYDQFESLGLFYTEIDENMKNYSCLKILEVGAINNRVPDKDLVVLEQMKKELLEEMDE